MAASLPSPVQEGSARTRSDNQARAGLRGPDRVLSLPTLCGSVLFGHTQGWSGKAPYLDDHKALGVPGHAGEFGHQLPEPWSTFRVYHPTWGRTELSVSVLPAACVQPYSLPLRSGLDKPC